MIAVQDVRKAYRSRQVLEGLRFEAAPGQITLLVGANGSGKSTTLRLLAGVSAPDAGRIAIGGHDLTTGRAQALAGMSYLPQAPRFHPLLRAGEILEFYARLRDVPLDRCRSVARAWQLEDVLHVPTSRLSGGMRQRLGLAVLMLPEAPVLLLDEPGLSLDPDWRRFLQLALYAEAGHGRTVIVATHLLGEWEDRVDRCLVLEGGRIGRELAPDRLREAFPFADEPPSRMTSGANLRRVR